MVEKFVTFEGGEGCGKSTQIKLLSKSLKKIGENHILTREPGGTKISEKIRNLLVKEKNQKLFPETELLLIYAARHEHLKQIIMPNLKKKKIVICDRFFYSTYSYQIIANNLEERKLKFLHKNFADNIFPDITILIDIDPKIGISRSLSRKNLENRFELKSKNFHNVVRKTYLKLSQNNSDIFKINGNNTRQAIHKKIVDHLNNRKVSQKTLPYSV